MAPDLSLYLLNVSNHEYVRNRRGFQGETTPRGRLKAITRSCTRIHVQGLGCARIYVSLGKGDGYFGSTGIISAKCNVRETDDSP